MGHFVEFQDVCKYYTMGEQRITAADHITFTIEQGEFTIIVGPSGAGKTTVLNMLGGMDTCDEGSIRLDGREISRYNRRQLTEYRRYDVGFVFQFYNLVQNLTALENVELASEICKNPLDAKDTLVEVGLGDRLRNFPAQLSGGEQQRVAIARGLTMDRRLLLADEPTGNLDSENSDNIIDLLLRLAHEENRCVIVVTHDLTVMDRADVVYRISDGLLQRRQKEK